MKGRKEGRMGGREEEKEEGKEERWKSIDFFSIPLYLGLYLWPDCFLGQNNLVAIY